MFARILVPTDFSDASDAALDCARVLAKQFGATIQLLHVLEPPFDAAAFTTEAYLAGRPGVYEMLLEEARALIAARIGPDDRAQGALRSEIIIGQSAPTILD